MIVQTKRSWGIRVTGADIFVIVVEVVFVFVFVFVASDITKRKGVEVFV